MKHLLTVLAAVPAIIAGALIPLQASAIGASCQIIAQQTPSGLHIEAMVHAPAGTSGNYDFAIEKVSAGGTANTTQGGTFALDGSGTAIVAVNDFDAGSVSGILRATVAGDSITCQKER